MKNRRERAPRLGSGMEKTEIVYGDCGIPEPDQLLGRERKVTPERDTRPRANVFICYLNLTITNKLSVPRSLLLSISRAPNEAWWHTPPEVKSSLAYGKGRWTGVHCRGQLALYRGALLGPAVLCFAKASGNCEGQGQGLPVIPALRS